MKVTELECAQMIGAGTQFRCVPPYFHLCCCCYYYYYYNRFTAHWTVSETTGASRYQKGKTRTLKRIWIYLSKTARDSE